LRERLKEAKGIGTPATRAEIIGGLKRQGFLTAQGKNIVPTETGLSLFGVLKRADPALVDPGVTAQLECLLDDVVLGKQEMVGAIDAVCEVAQRIIGKLTESSVGGPPLLGARGSPGTRSPIFTKRYADNRPQKKNVIPPPGEEVARAAVAPAGVGIKLGGSGRKSGRKSAGKPPKPNKSASKSPPKQRRRATADAPPSVAHPHPSEPATDTPLRIPYGNKAIAFNLGARYRPGGWYAPLGVDLTAFSERGWL
jgi:DNA topoisomerase-3